MFTPKSQSRQRLLAGEVGFIISGIKELQAAKVGDTVTLADRPAAAALPGFKVIKPQVFAGLYPVEANHYDALRDALTKLKLNDASLQYEPEVSQALGFGFRCGFLGLLHSRQRRVNRSNGMRMIGYVFSNMASARKSAASTAFSFLAKSQNKIKKTKSRILTCPCSNVTTTGRM